ncbi:nitroreductase family deazaflavin-dependent oxidoreductase [Microlunatus panaciterrae]|uniref:Deazaflavin-dependent oxidoreductase (Nitroreductase family) n=1 Tax=Microlunatus panaciterrae TaxID=400768 RepID=A0ABS2RJC7_9ACTN|nr:nitroreductase/quinone reductase family protein [Microlunatus panaciterrae]MBM7799105.1 deazaflavin-dependent oxidoreductase (nitroreductase family) [Microlunatus panaciterrae]
MADVQHALMRAFAELHIRVYRASGGRLMGKVRGIPVLLLSVAGRKTGRTRTTPVSYFEDEGRFIVTGSAGGAPAEPQWFLNLRRADRAEIEVGRRRIEVTVAIADADQREALWPRLLTHAPFFADYQAKVKRQLPMAILTPTA